MPRQGTWEEYKLLCIPIFWLGVSFKICLPIMEFSWLFFANFAFHVILSITFFKVWWYDDHYKGLQINVREPHVGFWKMPYDIDPAEVGTNPFGAAFFWHFSAVLIPGEAAIHMFMGNDLQRAAPDGNNMDCIGMMAQEMNHGTAQLFYSRGCEKCLGYPEGFRTLWKIVLIRMFPMKLKAAFFIWLECASMALELPLNYLPMKTEQIFGEPAWVYTWHFIEESEHGWDYVKETNPKVPWIWKAAMWLLAWPLLVCLWIQAILHALWYGMSTFRKHPSRLLTGLLVHIIFTQFLFFAMALSFLEMILGMRPNDVYEIALNGARQQFEEFKHLFKITHTQIPGSNALKQLQEIPPRSSIIGLRAARMTLYAEVKEGMRKNGMSEKEIKRTSFALAAEQNKYNPLL